MKMRQSWDSLGLIYYIYIPSKHAGSYLEAFWLQPVTASVQPQLAWMVYARFDFLHPFQFCFSKEGMDHTVQNWPGSDLDGLVRVWPNTSGLEASWCAGIIRPGFWQDAAGPLPVSHFQHFQTQFLSSTDIPGNIVQNHPGSDLVLADCVRFWPNRSGPEASQCARIIRPTSGQCFWANPDWMRIGSGMFTGYIYYYYWEREWERESITLTKSKHVLVWKLLVQIFAHLYIYIYIYIYRSFSWKLIKTVT